MRSLLSRCLLLTCLLLGLACCPCAGERGVQSHENEPQIDCDPPGGSLSVAPLPVAAAAAVPLASSCSL